MAMRVLKIRDVCEKLAVSRTALWRLCKRSDFPLQVQLGGRLSGFLEHEIDEWLEVQAAARVKGMAGHGS
ncbi:helix-turn-helix transcriptional regulator [Niveibacterium sp. 24ML]|uniref:helix-turn-helix transcriptional regulator n=1 Tax=Niveibacterium sp. 24ML TaxID=2985512 RepID=UPI003B63FC30